MRYKVFLFLLAIIHVAESVIAAPSIIAHRGGGKNHPENTLLAFYQALEMGCDGIELDVQVTLDNVVVAYHSSDLSTCTNGSGAIASKSWDEIATLDAGYRFQPESNFPYRSKGLRIPLLTEVLEAFPNIFIIIDLKSPEYEKLLLALTNTISDKEANRLVFYSTDNAPIEWINSRKPNWTTFETRDQTRQRLLELNQGLTEFSPLTKSWIGFELKRTMIVKESFTLGEGVSQIEFRLWNTEVVSELKKSYHRPKLVLFGINTEEEWNEALHLDVDMIYTDNPQKILQFSKSSSKKND